MKVINVEFNKYAWRVENRIVKEPVELITILAYGRFENGQTVIKYQKVKSDSFTALVLLLVEAEINGDI